MEAWSADAGVTDLTFDIAATMHLNSTPPRLPFTYPDYPVAVCMPYLATSRLTLAF